MSITNSNSIHHIIKSIQLFASYHVIIHHFNKVCLFSQSSSIFTYFFKTKLHNHKHHC